MARANTIRGLERGLQVLKVLSDLPIASLHEMHVSTRIPKPSLLRILNTLEKAGLVSQRLADGRYRASGNFGGMARKRDRHDRVAEAAAPVLHRLCQKIKWPSDLFVPAGDCMERRETSRPHSPFVFRSNHIIGVGQRVSWLLTGVGRTYLAYCPENEREKILQRLRLSDKLEDQLAQQPKRLEKIFAEIRERGYGARDPGYNGGGYGAVKFDDGLAAIVVPLRAGVRVYGSINILWIRAAFSVEQFAKLHLHDLNAAAAEIMVSLRR
jgi:IclR family mhp operon transcriptional activator